jgi:hypothetical protein
VRVVLTLHPDSRCSAAKRIDVDVAVRDGRSLMLTYVLTGDPTGLRMPPPSSPLRADRLWEHTCFEAFFGPSARAGYFELNFASSTRWAAYHFSDYRNGMRIAEEIAAPQIEADVTETGYTLRASLTFDRPPDLRGDRPWRLGLAAVIEETSGDRSYWAVAHPPGRADFHHPDCFALELPAAWPA